ncbi:hypothetical protein GCM10028796_29720 [Ramlibacter monticola]
MESANAAKTRETDKHRTHGPPSRSEASIMRAIANLGTPGCPEGVLAAPPAAPAPQAEPGNGAK